MNNKNIYRTNSGLILLVLSLLFIFGAKSALAGGGANNGGNNNATSDSSHTIVSTSGKTVTVVDGKTTTSYHDLDGDGKFDASYTQTDHDDKNSKSHTPGKTQNKPALGDFESVDPAACSVTGWAYDPDNSSTSISVRVYKGGVGGYRNPGERESFERTRFLVECTTDTLRTDINTARGISGKHGFTCLLPASFHNTGEYYVYIRAVDIGGTPNNKLAPTSRKINCQPQIASSTPTLRVCPNPVSLPVGETTNLQARYWTSPAFNPTCTDSGYTNVTQTATWSSANASVIAVTTTGTKGTITARTPGSTAIAATYRGLTSTSLITTNAVPPTISLSAKKTIVRSNDAPTLIWTITPDPLTDGSCRLTGPGITSAYTGDNPARVGITTSGAYTVPRGISNYSTYQLTCNGSYGDVSTTISVEVIPVAQEI